MDKIEADFPDPITSARPAASRSRRDSFQPFDTFRARSYFPALDGLRAISILLVLLHHLPRFESPILQLIQENGRYGVSFFFGISGFLIGTLLLREQRQYGRISLSKFYARRALRLLPLYYTVLAFQAVLVFGFHFHSAAAELLFRQKLPAYIFYYSNLLPTATDGPFFFAWSLAAEEQFYFCASLLLFLLPPPVVLVVTIAALAAKFIAFQIFGNIDATSTLWRITFSYQEPVLWGVLLAFALECRRWYEVIKRVLELRFIVPGCALLGLVWLFTHPFESQSRWDAEILFVLMTVVLAGVSMRSSPSVLGRGVPAHIGRISYGIYLLHYFVLVGVTKVIPGGTHPLVCLAASLLILVPLATAVYRWFERPIAAYGQRRFSPRGAAPASAGTASIQPGLPSHAQPSPAAGRRPLAGPLTNTLSAG